MLLTIVGQQVFYLLNRVHGMCIGQKLTSLLCVNPLSYIVDGFVFVVHPFYVLQHAHAEI